MASVDLSTLVIGGLTTSRSPHVAHPPIAQPHSRADVARHVLMPAVHSGVIGANAGTDLLAQRH